MFAGACGAGDESPSDDQNATTTASPAPSPAEEVELNGRLVFSRFDESTHTFISTHTSNANGSDERELPLPGPEGGGRWSHDGVHIAVMTLTDDGRVGTAIIAADGTVERVLALPDATLNLVCTVWSPDDARLACEGWDDTDPSRGGVYTVRSSDGGEVQRVTTPASGLADLPGDFSPDGTQLLFLRAPDEEHGDLILADLASGDTETLSDAQFGDPGRFSSDGTSILTASSGRLVVMGLDGEVLQELAEDGAVLFGAVWSPDGERIAFSRTTSGFKADVFISRPDGDERIQVTDTDANEIAVDWGTTPP